MARVLLIVLMGGLMGGLTVGLAAFRAEETRRVAITIDDLPFVSVNTLPDGEVRVRTEKLLGHLRRRSVPAIGFVNHLAPSLGYHPRSSEDDVRGRARARSVPSRAAVAR